MNNNTRFFNKVWQKLRNTNLVFLSSNSGTGKSTFYKWLFIRNALKGKFTFDIYFRYENELEQKFNNDNWLTLPAEASKRKRKIFDKVEIIKEFDNYFLIEKETGRKIAQGLAVNIQRKYKSSENAIHSKYALFDEILADDNRYCPDELYKFCRLIDTRARANEYHVLGLYNKVSFYFPYRDYFKNSGALFIDYIGNKFGEIKRTGIQAILSNTSYKEVYNNNKFLFYKEFFKGKKEKGTTLFYLNIENTIFRVIDCNDYFLLERKRKSKKSAIMFSLSLANNLSELVTNEALQFLQLALSKRLLFTNTLNDTIFIKTLADYCNLEYTI